MVAMLVAIFFWWQLLLASLFSCCTLVMPDVFCFCYSEARAWTGVPQQPLARYVAAVQLPARLCPPAELSSGAVLHCYFEACRGTLLSKQCYNRLTVSVCAEQH